MALIFRQLHQTSTSAMAQCMVMARRSLHFSMSSLNSVDNTIRNRIKEYVHSAPVVVFMKGTQNEPRCGFSRNVKLVLDLHQVPFRDFDVLQDEELRQGVKEFSDWPTIPQVYVNGKFIGGSDIVVQMHKDREIVKFFDEENIPSRYSEKFEQQSKDEDGGEQQNK